MEGVFLGKIRQTEFNPGRISLSFETRHPDQHVEVRKELDYYCDYVLVKADDLFKLNSDMYEKIIKLNEEKEKKEKLKEKLNKIYGICSAESEIRTENEKLKSENSELKKDRDYWKDRFNSVVTEVRYEWHPDCFTVICTKCDGTKEVVGMDLADDTDEKCTMGSFVCRSFNIPQCKNCKNHMYFGNTSGHYCHLPSSKYNISGMFDIRLLTDEEAEGPACGKFEAKE